jgi:hypothetical protein
MLRLREFSEKRINDLLEDAYSKESLCWTERKIYPDTNDFVKPKERDEMAAFLLKVCDREDMMLSIETFSLCLSLLDRFLSAFKVKSKYLECLAVACLYVASKVKEEDEKISITSEFLQDCMCQCSVSELLRMENMLLNKFEWNVNDVTTIDFVYLYYALLLSKFKENDLIKKQHDDTVDSSTPTAASLNNGYHSSNGNGNGSANNTAPKSKWKKIKTANRLIDEKHLKLYGYCPPLELDFLHTIEAKLKRCLCLDELIRAHRPRLLAYALIEVEIDKLLASKQTSVSSKRAINEIVKCMKTSSNLSDDQVELCKEKIISLHMDTPEPCSNLLIDSIDIGFLDQPLCLFDQYYIEMARNKINMMQPLSAISTHLSVIEEEEEESAYQQQAKQIENYDYDYDCDYNYNYNYNYDNHRRDERSLSDLDQNLIEEIDLISDAVDLASSDATSASSSVTHPKLEALHNRNALSTISNKVQFALNLLKPSSLNEKHSNNFKDSNANVDSESKEAAAALSYQKESHFTKAAASVTSSCVASYVSPLTLSLTYADILSGKREQKRKLSENSSNDEEFECENENRPL